MSVRPIQAAGSLARTGFMFPIMMAAFALCGCGSGGAGGGGSSGPPTISNLAYAPTGAYVASSGGTVTVNGSFSFTAANGGATSVTISVLDAAGAKVTSTTTPVPNGTNLTSGVIQGSVTASTATAGTFTIQVTLTDMAGKVSNVLSGSFRVTPFPWVAQAAMPTPRVHSAVVAIGSQFYVMGGEPIVSNVIPAPALSTVEVFDAATSTWSSGVSLPAPLEYLSTINVGGKIYAFGGSPGGVTPCAASSFAAVFDPVANAWTSLTAAPMVISGAAIAAIGTSIYVIGGIDTCPSTAGSSTVEVYDTGHNTWSTVASLPEVAIQLGAGVQNGKIVEFGGLLNLNGGSGDANPSQSIYDPGSNAWTVSPNGFVRDGALVVSDMATAMSGSNLFAIGGDTTIGTLEYGAWQFDPSTAGWISKEALPQTLPNSTTAAPVNGPMADSYNGQIFAFSPKATWVYTPANDIH
jgi:Kelch motif